jgi:hypothetical protein
MLERKVHNSLSQRGRVRVGGNNISKLSFPPPAPPTGRGVFVQALIIRSDVEWQKNKPLQWKRKILRRPSFSCQMKASDLGLLRKTAAGLKERLCRQKRKNSSSDTNSVPNDDQQCRPSQKNMGGVITILRGQHEAASKTHPIDTV